MRPSTGSEGTGNDHFRRVLLVLGFVLSIPVLWSIGLLLIAVGAVLVILGATGRAIGSRKYWY
jgi:hypothetical protein